MTRILSQQPDFCLMRYTRVMKILKIILTSLLFIALARASNATNFEQFGTTDGAGFAYSKFSVVEVNFTALSNWLEPRA